MKKLFIALITVCSFTANAQQNTLLNQDFWKNTPTIAAVKSEVEKGNSPSQLNGSSFDPAVMAINAQAPNDVITYLLDQPGNTTDKLTHDGRTYMHWAAYKGNAEIMEYLIAKKSKLDVEDSHGATPFTFAAGVGQTNTKVYDLLLTNGVDIKKEVNQEGANALLLAVSGDKDLTLTNYFVSKGLDIKSTDAAGNNAFSYAARGGNIDLLKALLAKGVPVNQTAILMAAQGRGGRGAPGSGTTLAVYQYLEGLGVKPTATSKIGQNVLHYLVRKPNQAEIITYFLSKGVDVNKADEEGSTPFIYAAASSRDTSVFNLLFPKVKNINQANLQGVTALALAVRSNSPAIVDLLISKGANVKVVDNKGNDLAYYLVESYGSPGERPFNGQRAADFDAKLKSLQDKGLDVKAPQKNGNTLYHLAVAKNSLSLLQHLQPLGIDVNAKNKEGVTALHKSAMISQNDAMLKYLISIGAKKEATTDFKETAYDLAKENETFKKSNTSIDFLK
ncbi:ankyrin repeat domain-containing protein [Mucilaginibacter glaciei]|uniref:Ankyrin repeat domain-containing protein n=1 Tax=Mucilaginibacter glaciei TaxID=2772109 RepID=A0A926S0C2_9SPHI|nr:ankyrin repeat domain-containing protein [Mucilaginibacter glaciei]MBD1391572.1 ankyrin repeat domain-containing protein [Mucilaginibacter glaciei]